MGPIFIKIGQKLLQTFGHSDYVFQFLGYFLYSVDSLKCVDPKTTPFFESSPILSGFIWPRTKIEAKITSYIWCFRAYFWACNLRYMPMLIFKNSTLDPGPWSHFKPI